MLKIETIDFAIVVFFTVAALASCAFVFLKYVKVCVFVTVPFVEATFKVIGEFAIFPSPIFTCVAEVAVFSGPLSTE